MGLLKIWLGRGAYRFEPAADVDLGVSFAAIVASSGFIGDLGVPAVHREFGVSAVNHEPVERVAADGTADFTTKFLQSRHAFVPFIVVP
jgi:hypothetical protein